MSDSSISRGTSIKNGSSSSMGGVMGEGEAVGDRPEVEDAVNHDNLFAVVTSSSISPSYTPTACGKSNFVLLGLGNNASLLALADKILLLPPPEVLAHPLLDPY